MDLNTNFLINHKDHFIESRLASANTYGYGNGSRIAGMIAAVAAGARRASATVERWARGTNTEIKEYRLPRISSVR